MPPLAYFLTWNTYGSWLPGDERGSIDHRRADRSARPIAPNRGLASHMESLLKSGPVVLDEAARRVVDEAIRDLAMEKNSALHALNVRTNHLHLVLRPTVRIDQAMAACKARATRMLRDQGLIASDAKVWARHGSTRMLHTEFSLQRAIFYTLTQQEHPTRFKTDAGKQGGAG